MHVVVFGGIVLGLLSLLYLTSGDELGNYVTYVTDCTFDRDQPFTSSAAGTQTDCQLTNFIAEAGTRLSVPFACTRLATSRVLWSFTAVNDEQGSGFIRSSVSSRSRCTNITVIRVDYATAGLYTVQTRTKNFAAGFLLIAVDRPTCDARSNKDNENALLTCSAVFAGNVPPHLEWVGLDRCKVSVRRINDSASRIDCSVNATSILVSKAVCKLTGEADVTGLMSRVAGLATDFAPFSRECWPTPDRDTSKKVKLLSNSYAHTMSSAQPNNPGPETAQINFKVFVSFTALIIIGIGFGCLLIVRCRIQTYFVI